MKAWLTVIAMCLMVAVSATNSALADARQRPVSYVVHSVGPVQLTLGAPEEIKRASIGSAADGWRHVDDAWEDGKLSLKLSADDLRAGVATIVLDAPKWLDMSDSEPPAVLRFAVDGTTCSDTLLDLGWVLRAPETIVLEVRDALNPLDRASVRVEYSGQALRPGDPGVRFRSKGPRHGRLELTTAEAEVTARAGETLVALVMDDMALDRSETVRRVSWRPSPSITLADGTVVGADSSTESEGWRDWSVIFDGSPMTDSETTTSGRTWLSAENAQAHWLVMDFPEPRTVTGIDLYWAFYQMWRTSRAYDVQTWDGEKWVTQVEVRDQTECGKSEHRFAPVTTTGLRVWQPPNSGQAGRAQYMWLSEVEVVGN